MHVYLEALGCRLNTAELDELARQFAGAGWTVTPSPDEAEVIVLNSCAVTATAARKSRHRLHTLHRRCPRARLAVVGCWATAEAARAEDLSGVDWVIPNHDKARAVEIITGIAAAPAAWEPGRWGHTRAFLAVQDGCNHTCTYCITRILRGPARSRTLPDVVATVRHLAAQGAQEVVLTGVSLGAYGHDRVGSGDLATLVEAILTETPLPRLRLSSVEPWDVDARLLQFLNHPRFCRQLHLPLQSGAEPVLRRMGRRFTPAQFEQLAAAARAICLEVALTTDLIAGFPGETEADFAATLDFVAHMGFARLHVFPYSERAGTPAARLPDSVPQAVRVERASQLRILGERLAAEYRAHFIGRTLPVLWEHKDALGRWHGLTDNYLEVFAPSALDMYNRVTLTRLTIVTDTGLQGEILDG
ncbi:MAG TPA: tRNA (N(6)-L-threonylcarbamoyladenosine(37)-C(2))-methylthiotransferase MtaB [Anaerolineae bacterium]|nr:tRNA (N(6)-L-threonylcarbamoyladenosine(37)-C(2))-methylthiotransferase MtaB [Anaerolineae bacterium]